MHNGWGWLPLAAEGATVVAGAGVVGTLCGKGVRAWSSLMRRVRRFLDDFEGTPARDGVPERPGVMHRLQALEQTSAATAASAASTAASAAETAEKLQAVVDELPKNGIPLAFKINALWAKYVAEENGPHLGEGE